MRHGFAAPAALAALVAASCATTRPVSAAGRSCPAGTLSPLLGCFRAVEARPSIAGAEGMRPGSLLVVEETQVGIYNDASTWARMRVRWNPPAGPGRLDGEYTSGGTLAIEQTAPDRFAIWDGSQVLGSVERLQGAEASAAAATFAALPSLEAMRERTRACFAAYATLMPGDPMVDQVKPETFQTTASAHGVIGLAQANLLRQCRPVPEPCALRLAHRRQRDAVEAAERACKERGAGR
jgi:hypothetical protein